MDGVKGQKVIATILFLVCGTISTIGRFYNIKLLSCRVVSMLKREGMIENSFILTCKLG